MLLVLERRLEDNKFNLMSFVAGLCEDIGGLDKVLNQCESVNNWEALRLYLEVVEDLSDL